MAKVIETPMDHEFRGKISGVIYSENSYGTYVKVRSAPRKRSTNKQIVARSMMRHIGKLWKTLTPEQYNKWDSLAKLLRGRDKNKKYCRSAYMLFMHVNLKRLHRGKGEIKEAGQTMDNG